MYYVLCFRDPADLPVISFSPCHGTGPTKCGTLRVACHSCKNDLYHMQYILVDDTCVHPNVRVFQGLTKLAAAGCRLFSLPLSTSACSRP